MNLLDIASILRRRRMALVAGLILAGLLAVFTYGHPGWSGRPTLTPRAAESWRVQSILFLTQEGFPWGRAVPSFSASNPNPATPPWPRVTVSASRVWRSFTPSSRRVTPSRPEPRGGEVT